MSVTGRALWYIESHLSDDLALETIAGAVGVSPFHLSRAFPVSTGIGLAGYVRARRLSHAASALAGGAPDILAVALDAGYGSHEAFTRAFRQQFDITPDAVRATGGTNTLALQEPLRMHTNATAPLAAHRVVTRGAVLLFGLGQNYGGQTNAGIPSQWNRFVPHLGHIPGQVGHVTYGAVCNAGAAGDFDYICAVEVSDFPAEPAAFTRLRVPPHRYAVFEHRDHVSSIQSTMKAVWDRGLADAGLQPADGPMLERYDERFDPRTGRGVIEIWVPIVG